jgi:hypothetical protein
MERSGGPLRGLWTGSTAAEDETRLLQGHEPAGRFFGPIVRFSRLQGFGRGWRSGTGADTASHSCPRPFRKRQRRSVRRSDGGNSIIGATKPWTTWPGCIIPTSRLDQLFQPLLQVGNEWHYTPKHGSWLDMAESELAVLTTQCLSRRIPNKQTLEREAAAWQHHGNKHHAKGRLAIHGGRRPRQAKKAVPSF